MSRARGPTDAWSIGERATLALVWEATAAKPGNVHRGADFENLTFADFAVSSLAVGRSLGETVGGGQAGGGRVGESVLAAVTAMHEAVGTNTHLGTVLLAAPLAIASTKEKPLINAVMEVLKTTTANDAELAYEAIRLASPGGLGKVEQADVSQAPAMPLRDAMTLAADRDLVARQYATGYEDVFRIAARLLEHHGAVSLHDAIVAAHVEQMAREPDSLIARKCGPQVARESADRAGATLDAGPIGGEAYWAAIADLDFWLRADGNRRNPGTTADLIGAALFVLLAEDRLSWPVRFYTPPQPPAPSP